MGNPLVAAWLWVQGMCLLFQHSAALSQMWMWVEEEITAADLSRCNRANVDRSRFLSSKQCFSPGPTFLLLPTRARRMQLLKESAVVPQGDHLDPGELGEALGCCSLPPIPGLTLFATGALHVERAPGRSACPCAPPGRDIPSIQSDLRRGWQWSDAERNALPKSLSRTENVLKSYSI